MFDFQHLWTRVTSSRKPSSQMMLSTTRSNSASVSPPFSMGKWRMDRESGGVAVAVATVAVEVAVAADVCTDDATGFMSVVSKGAVD
jgi:hypothetical protein